MAAARLPRCHLLTAVAGLREEVLRRLPALDLCVLDPASVDAHEVRSAEVILGDPALLKLQLAHLDSCKWIQSTWAGVESLVDHVRAQQQQQQQQHEGAGRRPPWVLTRFAGFFGPAMSQFVLAAILARERKVFAYAARQKSKEWEPRSEIKYRVLNTLTVGILGAGEIGREVGRTLKAMGMHTVGMVSSPPKRSGLAADFDEVIVGAENLPLILKQCDYVVNILPSTPSTRGLLTLEALGECAPERGTYFINVGRGDVVPDDAVWAEAADRGYISGATLDVYRKEPLPVDSVLWTHPKIQVFPHIAAVSFAADVATLFAQNLAHYVEGGPAHLQHQVDFERGY